MIMNYKTRLYYLSRCLEGLPLNQQGGYIRLCNRFALFLGDAFQNRDIDILAVTSVFVNPTALCQEALRACSRPLNYCRTRYYMVAALLRRISSSPGRLNHPGVLQLNRGSVKAWRDSRLLVLTVRVIAIRL